MTEIKVSCSKDYVVRIGKNELDNIGETIAKVLPTNRKLFVVSDSNVAPLYLRKVIENLQKSGYKTFSTIIEAGEQSKNLDNFAKLCSMAASVNLTRDDAFIALGGGVIGDLTGFVAASFMRGISYIQIPTSLLAAIDSSVGGKTAVDIPQGKNLVGAFHQPLMVVLDTSVLKTLPNEQWLCGLGEAIKYAVLLGGEIFDILNTGLNDDNIEKFIALCVEYKAKIVKADETEQGCRKLLNLGHSVGHAIEKLSNYNMPHGIAVAKGLVAICKAQKKTGSLSNEDCEKIIALCEKYDIDTSISDSKTDIIKAMQQDKKMDASGEISLILPLAIGEVKIQKMTLSEVEGYLI